MQELTKRQREILEYVHHAIRQEGYPPTIREIGAQFGIRSTNGVNDHLKALERKGYISRGDNKSRALSPTPKGLSELGVKGADGTVIPAVIPSTEMIEVPLVGQVAAGTPIIAEENISDTVHIDSFFLGGTTRRVFALRVVGDSMIDDGIFDGDYIFVKKQLTANRGEIVVAMIEGEATVKRYYPEGDRIRFQPANERMQPIYVSKDEFRDTHILGVVCGVYRRMH
ncbi:MAG: transcriptional repressor LexA [Deltaproteobacteria bacterium]|nr:transcriptional repressor LexA [Deltaproteobacteria bacterium]